MNQQEFIRRLTDKVMADAKDLRKREWYSASNWDGGAQELEKKLKHFLDGYEFAMNGTTLVYKDVYDEMVRETGSEYQRYLELKMKYEVK